MKSLRQFVNEYKQNSSEDESKILLESRDTTNRLRYHDSKGVEVYTKFRLLNQDFSKFKSLKT
jgi:hypothetical protein